jgi:hypothetical protein
MNRRDGLIWTGAITACLGLGILAGLFFPHWKSGLPTHPPQAIVLQADPLCNPLGATCVAGNEAFTIALELADLTKPLTFFPVRVHLTGTQIPEVKKVMISFSMLNMDMGFNRFDLRQQAETAWEGQALLPVCSMGRRDWRVTVDVVSEPPYAGEFHLLTGF